MTDPELEQLAALWRGPDPPDRKQIDALAAKARRRARLLDHADVLLVLVFVAVVLTSIPSPTASTVLPGIVLFAGLLWLNSMRRTARQMSLTLYTRDRESFLHGAIRHARIDLRYKLILLCLWVPGLMLAIMMKLSARHGGIGPAVANIPAWLVSIRGVTAISFIVLTAIWMLFRCRRSTAELGRLQALRRAYQDEAERDRAEES